MLAEIKPARRGRGACWWASRLLLGALLLMLLLGAGTWLAGRSARAALAGQYPAPGQLYDIGGYRLHLRCAGQGEPTVVLEAGLNDFSLQWSRAQPEVAAFARVCAYDRAGLGWSEPSPLPRTPDNMAGELHALLRTAGLPGPYVLVGHSYGGIVVRTFARRYPGEVAGLVLVDSAHDEHMARLPMLNKAAEQLGSQFRTLAALSRFGLLALAPEQIPARGLQGEALAQYRAVLASTGYFSAALAETQAFYTAQKVVATRPGEFARMPLIVLSRGRADPIPALSAAENAEYEQQWQQLQAELAGLASNSRQIIAEQSSHYIQLDQPELVIAAIRQILASV